jgi:hypothetical protein
MRRVLWVAVAVALAGTLWSLVPSVIIQRQLASVLQEHLQATRGLSVRARANAPGVLRGYIDQVDVSASGARLGGMRMEQLSAHLEGLTFGRTPGGALEITGVRAGSAELRIGPADVAGYLAQQGVRDPVVAIKPSGVTATGSVRAGPVTAEVRLQGRFIVVDRTDVHFQVDSLDVAGIDVPGPLATVLLGSMTGPIVSLRRLPVPVVITDLQVTSGRVVAIGRVEGPTP